MDKRERRGRHTARPHPQRPTRYAGASCALPAPDLGGVLPGGRAVPLQPLHIIDLVHLDLKGLLPGPSQGRGQVHPLPGLVAQGHSVRQWGGDQPSPLQAWTVGGGGCHLSRAQRPAQALAQGPGERTRGPTPEPSAQFWPRPSQPWLPQALTGGRALTHNPPLLLPPPGQTPSLPPLRPPTVPPLLGAPTVPAPPVSEWPNPNHALREGQAAHPGLQGWKVQGTEAGTADGGCPGSWAPAQERPRLDPQTQAPGWPPTPITVARVGPL